MPISTDPAARPRDRSELIRDHVAFLGSWLRRPLRVAAVAPSGRQLARLITDRIVPGTGPVLELGAGTGAFTAALIDKGVPPGDIHVIEMDDRMAQVLVDRFPEVKVTVANATMLARDGGMLPGPFVAAISGLPILAMTAQDQMRMLSGVFRRLLPSGALYQFTYGPICPIPALMLARLGLRSRRIGGVVRNLPPASVYRISRRGRQSQIMSMNVEAPPAPPSA